MQIPRALLAGPLLAALAAACGGGSADPGTAALQPTFSSINAVVLEHRCTGPCHSGAAAAGNLDLRSDGGWVALVGVSAKSMSCEGRGLTRIVPGDPGASLLYRLVEAKSGGPSAPCGQAMPMGAYAELSPEELDVLRVWIERGAPDD